VKIKSECLKVGAMITVAILCGFFTSRVLAVGPSCEYNTGVAGIHFDTIQTAMPAPNPPFVYMPLPAQVADPNINFCCECPAKVPPANGICHQFMYAVCQLPPQQGIAAKQRVWQRGLLVNAPNACNPNCTTSPALIAACPNWFCKKDISTFP
jgi:hypothetical protein